MKKKIRQITICLLALILIAFITLTAISWPKPTVVEQGQPILLSEEENQKNDGPFFLNYHSDLGWQSGAFKMTVTDTVVYDNYQDAGIQDADMSQTQTNLDGTNIKFVLIKIHAENIDATPFIENDYHMGSVTLLPEKFFKGLGVFDMMHVSEDYEINPVYFSGHSIMQQGALSDPYFHFQLPQGQSAEYSLGFYARESYLKENQMMLAYGVNKYASKIEVR